MVSNVSHVVGRSMAMVATAAAMCAGAWCLAADAVLDVARRFGQEGPATLAGRPFDELLTALCAAALLCCATWTLVVVTLAAVEAIADAATRGRSQVFRVGTWLCPDHVRRMLLAGCGIALATGLAAPAASADTGRAVGAPATAEPAIGGLRLPDRPASSPVGSSRTTTPVSPRTPATGLVSVAEGDSLWSIAEQALGGHPSNAETTAAWFAVYHANLNRIGNDPDLIFPGTALQIPDLDRSQRKEPT
jgi:hypothetical protein